MSRAEQNFMGRLWTRLQPPGTPHCWHVLPYKYKGDLFQAGDINEPRTEQCYKYRLASNAASSYHLRNGAISGKVNLTRRRSG